MSVSPRPRNLDGDEVADPVARLRSICLALPGVIERLSHGEPSFFVRKQFLVLDNHHHDASHLGFWCAAAPGVQQELIGENPQRFFRPPYVGHRGWLGVRIDEVDGVGPNWGEVDEIVRDAYRQVAPATIIAQLDA